MADDKQKSHPDNVTAEFEGWSDIRDKKRGCTDCLFLLILLAAWIGMTIIGLIVVGVIKSPTLQKGNPYRLLNAIDYNGRICGYDGNVTATPYGYYLPDKTAVCVSSCPSAADYNSFVCKYDLQAEVDNDRTSLKGYHFVSQSQCMYKIKSKIVLNRCLPDMSISAAATSYKKSSNQTSDMSTPYSSVASAASWVGLFLSDILTLRMLIFPVGIGMATVLSFGYLYFLRIPGLLFFLIWAIMSGILIFLLIGSILLFNLSKKWAVDGQARYEIITIQITSYIGFAATFLFFCFLLVIRKRISLAVGVIKETAKALATMPALILMPVVQTIGLCIFLVPWFIYVIYLASSGSTISVNATTSTGISYSYKQFVYTENTKYAFIFMLFVWFWTSEFIVAIGQLTISLSVVSWYFTKEKKKIGSGTVCWSSSTILRYHLGTAAFGSLIIAIIKTVRAVLAYIQKQAKKSKNKIVEYLLCVLQCCMWCLENCAKFVNKNAYIQTSIYGTSFCKSSRRAFFLILRNILRVAAVNVVADLILILGKLFVPIACTFVTYLIIAYGIPNTTINFIIAPLVMTWLLAYFISSMFSEVFSMAIETVLCCFIADEEMFPADSRFAEGGLKSLLDSAAKSAATPKVFAVKSADQPEPIRKAVI